MPNKNLILALPFFMKQSKPVALTQLAQFNITCANVFSNSIWAGWVSGRNWGSVSTSPASPVYTARSGNNRAVNGVFTTTAPSGIGLVVRISVNATTPIDDMPDRIVITDPNNPTISDATMEIASTYATRGLGNQYDYAVVEGDSNQLQQLFAANNVIQITLYYTS